MQFKWKLDRTRCGAQHSVRAALRGSSVTWVDMVAPPTAEKSFSEKVDFQWKPETTVLFFAVCGPKFTRLCQQKRSLQRLFLIVGILFRSGDIRDRSAKSSEIAPKKACFLPQICFLGVNPRILDPVFKIVPISDMWQSFAAIGRETAEISRWIKKTAAKYKGRVCVITQRAALNSSKTKACPGGPNKKYVSWNEVSVPLPSYSCNVKSSSVKILQPFLVLNKPPALNCHHLWQVTSSVTWPQDS